MAGWADLHWSGRNVHVSKLFELVIHAGKFFLHIVGGLVGDIQIHAAVLRAAASPHLGVDSTTAHGARPKFHALGAGLLHEAPAPVVFERTAFAAPRVCPPDTRL